MFKRKVGNMVVNIMISVVTAVYLLAVLILLFLSRKEESSRDEKGVMAAVRKAGLYLIKKPWMKRIISPKVRTRLSVLYPVSDRDKIVREYYGEKIAEGMLIMLAGLFVLLVAVWSEYNDSILVDGNRLIRPGYSDENTEVSLIITDSVGKETRKLDYELLGRTYEKKQLDALAEKMEEGLAQLILGENEDTEHVTEMLVLSSGYEGYPFAVDWESSDYTVVDSDGTVMSEELSQPRIVLLTALLSYREYEYEITMPVRVCHKEEGVEEKREKLLKDVISDADEKQRTESELRLPTRIFGKEVAYRIEGQGSTAALLPFVFVIPVLLFFIKDRDLEKEITEKRFRIERAYPDFVSKFALLFGAGLSVRSVLLRLSGDEDISNELRLELKILVRDLGNGIMEQTALDNFGRRMQSPLYIKFCSLLIQNMKNGNNELLKLLSEETAAAAVLRRNHAKKLGEEAGTKLLFPMVMMLGVVMVVIVVPAFMSF